MKLASPKEVFTLVNLESLDLSKKGSNFLIGIVTINAVDESAHELEKEKLLF